MSLAYSPHSTQLVIEITLNEPCTDDCFSLIQEAKQYLSVYLRRFQNAFGFAEGILYAPSGPTVSALETLFPSTLVIEGQPFPHIAPSDHVESNPFLIQGNKLHKTYNSNIMLPGKGILQ